MKQCAQGHTASRSQSWVLNSGGLALGLGWYTQHVLCHNLLTTWPWATLFALSEPQFPVWCGIITAPLSVVLSSK